MRRRPIDSLRELARIEKERRTAGLGAASEKRHAAERDESAATARRESVKSALEAGLADVERSADEGVLRAGHLSASTAWRSSTERRLAESDAAVDVAVRATELARVEEESARGALARASRAEDVVAERVAQRLAEERVAARRKDEETADEAWSARAAHEKGERA